MKFKKLSFALAITAFSTVTSASETFTGNITYIDYSNDVKAKYDIAVYVSDMKVRTNNPFGIGFTPEKNAELIGTCSDRMYLNKNRSKNFHTVLSAIMSSQVNNNSVEVTVNNNTDCLITEIGVSYKK
jgi:hypothetical protein